MPASEIHSAAATATTATTRSRGRKATAAAVAGVGAAAVLVMVAGSLTSAATLPTTNCSATPSRCGYPDATNTGGPAAMTLKSVPAQVSSGPGWTSRPDGSVEVSGNGAVLSGLSITGNLDISADNVVINGVKVVTGGNFGVTLRHTTGVTIENSLISGKDAAAGRVSYAVDDIYGDSTGMTVKHNNIAYYRTAVAVSTGLVTGNYIHDPGYVAGDHTNGIFDAGTTQPLTISNNTIFNSLGQTDAISLNASSTGSPVANKTVTGNLLAGGGYVIYGGSSLGNTTTNMVIKNNDFGQAYYPKSGYYGPAAYFNSGGTGNAWTGNTWDTTGLAVPAP